MGGIELAFKRWLCLEESKLSWNTIDLNEAYLNTISAVKGLYVLRKPRLNFGIGQGIEDKSTGHV